MATLRVLQPILEIPGVLVVGSEVPNLLQAGAASTLVVSQDVHIAVPLECVSRVKDHLGNLHGLVRSLDEPSVFVPTSSALIEANFLGLDRRIREAADTYVFEDPDLPLMVFGPLGLLRSGPVIDVDGLKLPLPRVADLMVEKLVTDRTGEKGARDLLVVAGLLTAAPAGAIDELVALVGTLSPEARHTVRGSLTVLSLMDGVPSMPDPLPTRQTVESILERLERNEDADA